MSEKIAQMYLRAAADWEAKSNSVSSARNYGGALLAYASACVLQLPSAELGQEFLRNRDFAGVLARYCAATSRLSEMVSRRELPASALGGNYPRLVLAHFGVLLGEVGLVEEVMGCARSEATRGMDTAFWRYYGQAFDRLLNGQVVEQPDVKASGDEKTWVPYLRLMALLSRGVDTTDARLEVEEAFRKRNSNKRFNTDPYGVEGSGTAPVKWDFRLASLLARRI